ncbi:hypothetical protein A3SAC12_0015 [Lactobacillus phage 3-SAC12]|nr:hypothetical protein A3SAC12_0015 [Lactobacillus phage 3-SAC12]
MPRFTCNSNIFFSKSEIKRIFKTRPEIALKWAIYIHGDNNISFEDIENMNGNELSILQYATEERMKEKQYARASAIALAFGGSKGGQ